MKLVLNTIVIACLSLTMQVNLRQYEFRYNVRPDITNENDQVVFEKAADLLNQYLFSDKIIKSFQIEDEIKKSWEEKTLVFETTQDPAEQKKIYEERFNNEFMVKRMRNTRRVFELRYPLLWDQEGWDQHVNEPDKKIFYKKEKGNNIITQYIEAVLYSPLMNSLILSNEVDLHSSWIPNVGQSKLPKIASPLHTVLHQKFNLPWPMKSREQFLESQSFVLEDDQALFTVVSTIPDGKFLDVDLKASHGSVNMIFRDCISYFKPIGVNRTLLQMIIYFDPQVQFLPKWFMDYFIRSVTGIAVPYMQNSSSDLPEVYFERYREREEFYSQLREEIQVILDKEQEFLEEAKKQGSHQQQQQDKKEDRSGIKDDSL
ncbi:UNKNOWN [Stylonychia lemnae]|uniref:START domain-containing protein n=1 Tax=Stylonychia lemnae TaxID=5949 RepID=A0A077ZP51_STYLE|nr:UNKNOWN [Stylonychia lemnae]|eukprot:CDW71742.1 UNKNOWN [Stylonychia lemnae]